MKRLMLAMSVLRRHHKCIRALFLFCLFNLLLIVFLRGPRNSRHKFVVGHNSADETPPLSMLAYNSTPYDDAEIARQTAERLRGKLWYVHVPKTGTSFQAAILWARCSELYPEYLLDGGVPQGSILRIMEREIRAGNAKLLQQDSNDNPVFDAETAKRRECVEKFSSLQNAHPPYKPMSNAPMVMMLREPFSRVVSGYLHGFHDCNAMFSRAEYTAIEDECDPNYDTCSKFFDLVERSFDDEASPFHIVKYAQCVAGCATNMLIGRWCQLDPRPSAEESKRAQELFEQRVAFAGLTDRWRETVELWAAVHGRDLVPALLANDRPSVAPRGLPGRVMGALKASGWEDSSDQALYDMALRRLSQLSRHLATPHPLLPAPPSVHASGGKAAEGGEEEAVARAHLDLFLAEGARAVQASSSMHGDACAGDGWTVSRGEGGGAAGCQLVLHAQQTLFPAGMSMGGESLGSGSRMLDARLRVVENSKVVWVLSAGPAGSTVRGLLDAFGHAVQDVFEEVPLLPLFRSQAGEHAGRDGELLAFFRNRSAGKRVLGVLENPWSRLLSAMREHDASRTDIERVLKMYKLGLQEFEGREQLLPQAFFLNGVALTLLVASPSIADAIAASLASIYPQHSLELHQRAGQQQGGLGGDDKLDRARAEATLRQLRAAHGDLLRDYALDHALFAAALRCGCL